LACRRCWGLTYVSRTLYNYKDSLWGRGQIARMFGTSQRDWAYQWTADRMAKRRSASRDRWGDRRKLLKRVGSVNLLGPPTPRLGNDAEAADAKQGQRRRFRHRS
jgi:hypothetical protein